MERLSDVQCALTRSLSAFARAGVLALQLARPGLFLVIRDITGPHAHTGCSNAFRIRAIRKSWLGALRRRAACCHPQTRPCPAIHICRGQRCRCRRVAAGGEVTQ